MVKYKCFKTQCPECGNFGSLQLFINNSNRVTYSRVRHYNGKQKYTYCKIQNIEALKTLLSNKNISIHTNKTNKGQKGQNNNYHYIDQQLRISSLKSKNMWAGSSARIEHHPPKVGVVGSNPTPPAWTYTHYLWKNT